MDGRTLDQRFLDRGFLEGRDVDRGVLGWLQLGLTTTDGAHGLREIPRANVTPGGGMAEVTGIGGVFFRSDDPKELTAWYVEHLGLPVDDAGFVVLWWGDAVRGSTVWAPFPVDTVDFGWPADKQWVINYRVDDLDGMLGQLRERGVDTSNETFEDENGRFGHCTDPEGNLVQLWQPNPGM